MKDVAGNNVPVQDEIETYLNAHYLSSSKAIHKIFDFPMHRQKQPVVKLCCHLPEEQQEGQELPEVDRGEPVTMLTGYFKLNQRDHEAFHILYAWLPHYFTWNTKAKQWQ